ncbi:glycosyltransferase family 4 protein [Synechococcus sp. UW105]|uniref:glycosyltransferase family 4 protein n=1 Tax=Synechococcus sp. UW105 TaxID=337067 RepID=UPI000E0E66FA|nr:glycosyltransferase family 4 protein [Synechococcus sp. UW105]
MPRLWLINQFANTPDLPGHTRQYEVAASLVNNGWDVSVFSSDFNLAQRKYRRLRFPQLASKETPSGIHWFWLWVFPYRCNNWRRQLNMLSFCFHLALRLLPTGLFGILTGKGPNVILASSPQLPAAFTALCIARLYHIPFVLEVRDLWPQVLIDQCGKSRNNILVRLLSFMESYIYSHSSQLVVLAKGAVSYVEARGARHIEWLPNGPDLDLFIPTPLPPERTNFKVLYAGAHGVANGLDNVIEAARLLENKSLPISIQFLGDGPEKDKLIQLASDLNSVTFSEPVPKSLIPEIMADADAILLSLIDVPLFRYAVSPNKLYDAYALGRPVITTVPGDINTEVESYKLGFTALPGIPEDLAFAIQQLFETSILERKAMAERAVVLSKTVYSRQLINVRFNALLRTVIGQ